MKSDEINYHVYTDGGARGNPGPAGIGVVISNSQGKVVKEISKSIGLATNNQAEYWAVIFALEALIDFPESKKVNFFLDSKLVVEQINGNYKIKNLGLKPLYERVKSLVKQLGIDVVFEHVPRRKNKRADELVNEAIDKALKNSKS